MVPLSVKQNPLLQKQFKASTPSMCHTKQHCLKKEDGRVTFERKTNNSSHAGAGKASKAHARQEGPGKKMGDFLTALKLSQENDGLQLEHTNQLLWQRSPKERSPASSTEVVS